MRVPLAAFAIVFFVATVLVLPVTASLNHGSDEFTQLLSKAEAHSGKKFDTMDLSEAESRSGKHAAAVISKSVPPESRSFLEQEAALKTKSTGSVLSEASIKMTPLLPGVELLGMGIDIKRGIDLSSNTRSLVVPPSDESVRDSLLPFVVDDTTAYMVPPFAAVQRNFDSSIETKIFSNNAQKAMDLAAGVMLEVTVMGIGGAADLKMKYLKDEKSKAVVTTNTLNVQLYELMASRLLLQDLDPLLLAEFDELPITWDGSPIAYFNFVQRWGTHFVKSVKVGGQFRTAGTTICALEMSNIEVAAKLSIILELGPLKATGSIKFDLKLQKKVQELRNSFDYFVRGGNVALGARVAQAQADTVNVAPVVGVDDAVKVAEASAQATLDWLRSIKTSPAIISYEFGRLTEFLQILANTPTRVAKLISLQKAIDVYMREGDPNKMMFMLTQSKGFFFSNFLRPAIGIGGSCLRFAAIVGKENEIVVRMTGTADPSNPDAGYDLRIGARSVRITRAGTTVASVQDVEAVHPGNSDVYGTFKVCYLEQLSTILYLRHDTVMLHYRDPAPLAVLFFGFGTVGKESVTVADIMSSPARSLTCKTVAGNICNGRGKCGSDFICECEDGWMGAACQAACPTTSDGTCSKRGVCRKTSPYSNDAAFCQCGLGFLGEACEFQVTPKVEIVSKMPLLSDRSSAFDIRLSVDVDTMSKQGLAVADLPVPDWSRIPISQLKWSVQMDGAAPVDMVGNGAISRRLAAGTGLVSVEVRFQNADTVVTGRLPITVTDCYCSGRGTCNDAGACQCNQQSTGDQCEVAEFNGLAKVQQMGGTFGSYNQFVPFSALFASAPKQIKFGETPANVRVSASQITPSGFTLLAQATLAERDESGAQGAPRPAQPVASFEVKYAVMGELAVPSQAGSMELGAAEIGPLLTTIVFTKPWTTTPYVTVELTNVCCGLQFSTLVTAVSTRAATVRVHRVDPGVTPNAGWTQTQVRLQWTAVPYPLADGPLSGEFNVGATAQAPVNLFIPFGQPYRELPRVGVEPFKYNGNAVFSLQVSSVLNHGFWLHVKRTDSLSPLDGWQDKLMVQWNAQPNTEDASTAGRSNKVLTVDNLEYLLDVNLPFANLPNMPIILPANTRAGPKVCAQLCIDRKDCIAFSYVFGDKAAEMSQSCPSFDKWSGTTACFLKGIVSGWRQENKCAISGILPSVGRSLSPGTEIEVAMGGCDNTESWATAPFDVSLPELIRLGGGPSELASCPSNGLLRGFYLTDFACPGGLALVLRCTFPAFLASKDARRDATSSVLDAKCNHLRDEWGGMEYLDRLTNFEGIQRCPSSAPIQGLGIGPCTSTWQAPAAADWEPIGQTQEDKLTDRVDWLFAKSKVFYRRCDDCAPSHKTIFYKRLSPIGSFSVYSNIFDTWRSENNALNKDFALYSSYDDLMNDNNRWKFCNFDDDGVGFPRDCGPQSAVGGQWSSGWKHQGRQAQFFVKKNTHDKEFGANHLHLKYNCLKYSTPAIAETRVVSSTCGVLPPKGVGVALLAKTKGSEFQSVTAPVGWWYQGTVNGKQVGLLKQPNGNQYLTAPNGGAVTGCVVKIDGKWTHVVLSSDGSLWCSQDAANWRQCPEFKGAFNDGFIRTHHYLFGKDLDLPKVEFQTLNFPSGWWYQGIINGKQVGLKKVAAGDHNYATAPDGAAVTGCIVKINGQWTHVVVNHAGNTHCSTDGHRWTLCLQYVDTFSAKYVKTDKYPHGVDYSKAVKKVNTPSEFQGHDQHVIGCYADQGNRDLPVHIEDSQMMTPARCFDLARRRGYQYFGLQYHYQCFAGNSYGRHTRTHDGRALKCDTPCAGDKSVICGGGWANTVFSVKPLRDRPQYLGYNQHHVGCFADTAQRDVDVLLEVSDKMTPARCQHLANMRNLRYFSIQVGRECFGGNTYGKYGQSKGCDFVCTGDTSIKCGGAWANTVFSVKPLGATMVGKQPMSVLTRLPPAVCPDNMVMSGAHLTRCGEDLEYLHWSFECIRFFESK